MDLGDILSYKPDTSSKRPRQEEEEEEKDEVAAPPLKKSNGSIAEGELTDEQKLKLLQNLSDDEDENPEVLDAGAVKRMLLSFEKQVLKNQEMRIKFPDQPDKFMESELELNDEIQSLHIISTVPQYYSLLIGARTINTLCSLLTHDNSDICIAVIDLLQELTDTSSIDETEYTEALVEELLNEKLLALLVQILERLDEKVSEDKEGVHNTLAIIENISEILNKPVTTAAGEQGLLTWLLKRVRIRQYDENKLYASEILAILLQDHTPNQSLLGNSDGIDILLQSLAYYKRRDPHSSDEIELMENLFDCLCSSLMYPPNRDKFLKGEGLQLMRLMLQSKKLSRRSSLKVLNHAMCGGGAECRDNCEKFIEIFGLGSLFPAFMKTPRGVKKGTGTEEQEEHVTSIIASLFRHVSGGGRDRLVSKFVENDHEKVDRLLELHLKYKNKIREVDESIRNERRYRVTTGGDEENEEEMTFLRRLEAGLFKLQLIDYIITELCLSGIPSIRGRVITILGQRGGALVDVVNVMREYVDGLGEENEDEKAEKKRLAELLKNFETSI
ncbi:PREDICTED: beta-catenin-like protein 1 [Amphimedon queenslandica]|uniref:Beta-catenin-like protein 1 n=1 Tax=Amphimedon queenslandica TaxID=400682 RepID=A0A1X7UV13_AMPQE|nr:PREDICTED: beta-catenin-like protein 1 [Amphimedon queenslandica]|eukprot:XP_003386785.1 PREDICTED: beta-catenin-like protein 1 [Amphimedon queenslandica]